MQRSDDSGGTRGPRADAGEPEALRVEQVPTSSLRDRIRQASTAAARVSDLPPAPQPAGGPKAASSLSSPPELSGVHSRPAERPQAGSSGPPSLSNLFAAPVPGALRPPAVPKGVAPVSERTPTLTQLGLGVVPRPATSVAPAKPAVTHWPAPPRRQGSNKTLPAVVAPVVTSRTGNTVSEDITTARTQPMQRVAVPTQSVGGSTARPPQPAVSAPPAQPRRKAITPASAPAPAAAAQSPVPGLLRASPTATARDGRYSVHDVSAEYIETRPRSTPPVSTQPPTAATVPMPKAAAVEVTLASATRELGDDDFDDASLRSRRSTPKERPGRRRPTRVARHEVGARRQAPTSRVAARDDDSGIQSLERGDEEVTVIRVDLDASHAVRAAAAPAPAPARKTPSALPQPRAAARASAPSAPAVPAAVAPRAWSPATSVAELPAIMVDPALGPHSVASASTPSPPAPASSYEPLPADRDSFEAFMRDRMKDSAHLRPGWAEQETSLISRDSFRSPAVEVGPIGIGSAMRTLLVVGVVLAAGGGGLVWLKSRQAPADIAVTPLSADPGEQAPVVPGSQLMTLMVSEPAGAEIVIGGAVVGNTPAEVPRPKQNDELYLLRMPGFESQLVRLSAAREVVSVTLRPLGFRDPAALPAEGSPTPGVAP